MNKECKCEVNGSTNFLSLLTILFIGLKLGGVINWSWWWVLSPIWISFIVALAIFFVVFVFVDSK